jgi:hypothetical protein
VTTLWPDDHQAVRTGFGEFVEMVSQLGKYNLRMATERLPVSLFGSLDDRAAVVQLGR